MSGRGIVMDPNSLQAPSIHEPSLRRRTRDGSPSSDCMSHFTVQLPETMPYHWRREFLRSWRWARPLLGWIWGWLCSITFGHDGLEEVWAAIRMSESDFQEHMTQMVNRMNNMLIVAGLFLGSVTTLLTASPPRPDIFDFSKRASYLLIGCCFGILLGGILCGFGCVHIMGTCKRTWAVDVLCANRARVWCMLAVLSYPFISIIVAIHCCIAGFFVSLVTSEDMIVRIGSTFLYIVPFSLYIPVFFLSRKPGGKRNLSQFPRGRAPPSPALRPRSHDVDPEADVEVKVTEGV